MSTTNWVNRDILRWARKRLNLNYNEVAEESKKLARRHYATVSPEELTAWEERREDPDLEHLETLAEIYVCPVGYFFLESIPQVRQLVAFRGLAKDESALSSTTHRGLQRFSELAQWTVDLLRRTEQPWPVRFERHRLASDLQAAEHLAREYRQRFGWTPQQRQTFGGKSAEAFRWWRQVIENQGVFCFEMRLDPKEARGASLWCEGYPFILVNHEEAEAAAGRIFTLLHEYAHLISADEGIVCDCRGIRHGENPEPFANRFAARLLLLPEELRQRLEEIGEDHRRNDWPNRLLDTIRKPLLISRDVVAILLQELGLARSDFYEERRQEWEGKRPFGRRGKPSTQAERKIREVGYSLAGVLTRSAERPTFSWTDASSVLGMKIEKVDRFLQWVRQR